MDRAEVIRGKKIFGKYDAGCPDHKDTVTAINCSVQSGNLLSPATEGRSGEDLISTIHEGKPNMPAWKHRLSRQDSQDVLTYIRSLSAGK